MSTHILNVQGIGEVEITVAERGTGRPVLLLHGGAGPQSMMGFAELLAGTRGARVLVPTHPGFGGTPRPEALGDIQGLARAYSVLLDELGLSDVTVVGNSVGGWIAAELAVLGNPRVGRIVLNSATGIMVPGHPVADPFSLSLDELTKLSYHTPERFRIDLSSLPPAARAAAAVNRATLARYAGNMTDASLASRLATITLPVAVLWGESDRVVDAEYGRAYAGAIPGAVFRLLPATGHMPQLETPGLLADELSAFIQMSTAA